MARDRPHPPVPGPMVQPNFLAVEEALGDVTFPISKRELMDSVRDRTVIFDGRNVDLRDLVRDLRDDFFDSEEEFHDALSTAFGALDEEAAETRAPPPPTQPEAAWNAPEPGGGERGIADVQEYGDTRP